jgi:hypothetical protein
MKLKVSTVAVKEKLQGFELFFWQFDGGIPNGDGFSSMSMGFTAKNSVFVVINH